MKRDMDLARDILLAIEKASEPVDATTLIGDGGPSISEVAFHVELLQAHGLMKASVSRAFGQDSVRVMLDSLTWEGYDYLDAIRSERVWAKAKKAISESVGDTSLSVIKETCSALALATIKANLGI